MKRVLLTGATGFVGRQCVEPLLRRGFAVHALTSGETVPPLTDGVRWHRANLLESGSAGQLLREVRPSHLLHLAWYVEHGAFWKSPVNLDWVAASLELLRAFIETGGERYVMGGTCAQYAWDRDDLVERASPTEPTTLYGASKQALELVALRFGEQEGVQAATGRIFFPFGPVEAEGRLIPSVIRALLEGRPAKCSHGRQVRDFLYVEDVGAAFAALLDSSVEGPVNIGSGVGRELREVVLALGDLLHAGHLIRLGEIPEAPHDPPRLVADVSRLRDEVGWTPLHSFEDALSKTVDWWRAAGQTRNALSIR